MVNRIFNEIFSMDRPGFLDRIDRLFAIHPVVALLGPRQCGKTTVALEKMRDELERILGRRVDLLTRNGLNRHIRDEVLRNAETIHAE